MIREEYPTLFPMMQWASRLSPSAVEILDAITRFPSVDYGHGGTIPDGISRQQFQDDIACMAAPLKFPYPASDKRYRKADNSYIGSVFDEMHLHILNDREYYLNYSLAPMANDFFLYIKHYPIVNKAFPKLYLMDSSRQSRRSESLQYSFRILCFLFQNAMPADWTRPVEPFTVDLDDLREFISPEKADTEGFRQYKFFRQRILSRAQKDIYDMLGIWFTFTTDSHQSPSSITFVIHDGTSSQN